MTVTTNLPRPDISAHTFRTQSSGAHVAAVVVGGILAVSSYVQVVILLGGPPALSSQETVLARQLALTASGFLLAVYLATAFIQGYGGPLLNLLYLLSHFLLTPGVGVLLAEGPVPDPLVFSAPLFTPIFVGEALLMALVPLTTYIAGHTVWFRVACSPAQRVAWADEHLPSLYRDTLVDPARFDR